MVQAWIIGVVVGGISIAFLGGIRIVRQTERGLIERFGKYKKYASPGFHWIIPMVDRMVQVDITEQMITARPQEIITKDNLNATVDAQVYFKVKDDEKSVKASEYNVQNYTVQIVALAQTTLRNIIGSLSLKEANSERNKINGELMRTLKIETENWGIDVVRTELKEINPPKDVQETMNKVVKAENEKIAAVDTATALETEADGQRRAEIKKAEGFKQAKILQAEGEAAAIKTVNEAAEKYFVGNAQILKKLEVTQASLEGNAKIIITEQGISPTIVLGDDGIIPLAGKKK